jgi:hypothetical protein
MAVNGDGKQDAHGELRYGTSKMHVVGGLVVMVGVGVS